MPFITGKHLSRRTFLRGMGASVALPSLDAMIPAGRLWQDRTRDAGFTRLVCIEESMGSAGSSDWGNSRHLFAPERVGDNGGRTAISTSGNETDFGIAAIYSLGRDGLPGPGADGDDPLNYFRETGALGTGDDLVRFF